MGGNDKDLKQPTKTNPIANGNKTFYSEARLLKYKANIQNYNFG